MLDLPVDVLSAIDHILEPESSEFTLKLGERETQAFACEQRSDEWRALKVGKIGASSVDKVLARIKTGEAASRRDYRAQIVAEILTGVSQDRAFQSEEMRWGVEQEPAARAAYSAATGLEVVEVGWANHPRIERAGASPDGVVSPGLVEIKCPKTATHLLYLLGGIVPTDYQPQMLWQMACTGAEWVDFVSYDPRLNEELQLFVRRMPRDEKRISEMEAEVEKFLAEALEMVDKLRALKRA